MGHFLLLVWFVQHVLAAKSTVQGQVGHSPTKMRPLRCMMKLGREYLKHRVSQLSQAHVATLKPRNIFGPRAVKKAILFSVPAMSRFSEESCLYTGVRSDLVVRKIQKKTSKESVRWGQWSCFTLIQGEKTSCSLYTVYVFVVMSYIYIYTVLFFIFTLKFSPS